MKETPKDDCPPALDRESEQQDGSARDRQQRLLGGRSGLAPTQCIGVLMTTRHRPATWERGSEVADANEGRPRKKPRARRSPRGSANWNPAGRLRGSRNKLSEEVICALLRDFRKHGEKAIAKVRRDQPGVYLKVLALLIPRQDKLEHTNTIKTMTDEELESAIAILNEMMAAQAVGSAHLIEMKAEPAALPAPETQSIETVPEPKPPRRPNRLLEHADTAIGTRERRPRTRVPSPPGA